MLHSIKIDVRNGGFIVTVVDNDAEQGFEDTEFICTTYGKLMKRLKYELEDLKPVRKPRAKKEVV